MFFGHFRGDMYQEMGPIPQFGRIMVFVDGENLVYRYQAMIKRGYIPRDEIVHIPDVLVWFPGFTWVGANNVIRANYYTYVVGDEPKILELKQKIRSLTLSQHRNASYQTCLSPVIFKKLQKSAKRKGVDIQLTVDVLHHVHNNNVDAICLLSGDGDYIPLIEEVLSHGKRVHLAAFSDGLHPDLEPLVDMFYCLDGTTWQKVPEKSIDASGRAESLSST